MHGDSHVKDGCEAVFSLTLGPYTGNTTYLYLDGPQKAATEGNKHPDTLQAWNFAKPNYTFPLCCFCL